MAVSEYAESGQNEDSLTGDLWSALRKRINSVKNDDGTWQWRIRYRKFGSGGEESEEKVIGADGIFQLELYGEANELIQAKGLLFQSKKSTDTHRSKMFGQLQDMEQLVPNGSCLFEYGPDGYYGLASDVALQGKRDDLSFSEMPKESLASFLMENFVGCTVGARNLYYDFGGQILVVPKKTDAVELYNTRLKHKLIIEVYRPRRMQN